VRRLLALSVAVVCAASCEVRSDLVLPPAGNEGAPDAGGVVPAEASPIDASRPAKDAANESIPDATSPPPDAISPPLDAAAPPLDASSLDAAAER
jgi:hypothetical protein